MSVLWSYKNIKIVFLIWKEKNKTTKTPVHMWLNLKKKKIDGVPGACVCAPKGNIVYCVIISHSL